MAAEFTYYTYHFTVTQYDITIDAKNCFSLDYADIDFIALESHDDKDVLTLRIDYKGRCKYTSSGSGNDTTQVFLALEKRMLKFKSTFLRRLIYRWFIA